MTENFKFGWDGSQSVESDFRLLAPILVEKAGFDSVWYGDHFFPWHHSRDARTFFVWSVMTAAAERTKKISIGVSVTTPIGGRYHPALIAHACTTLGNMFPERILLGVGSGEAVNESIFMQWPSWQERMERLTEGICLIRKLWDSEDLFTFNGRYWKIEKAFLYGKPTKPIPIYFAASGKKSAYYAGKYGDHLLVLNTLNTPDDCTVLFSKFDAGRRDAGRDADDTEKAAFILGGVGDVNAIIDEIRRADPGIFLPEGIDNPDPRQIAEMAQKLSNEEIRKHYGIFANANELIEYLDRWKKAGANHIIFGTFSSEFETVIDIFKNKVIPYFKGK